MRNIYCDSSNPSAGDGSQANPYRTLASIPWTTGSPSIAASIAAGDTVIINLKRGSVFREQLTIGASGAAGRPITIQDYGTGAKPQIRGDELLTGWTSAPGLGSTWQVPLSLSVPICFANQEYLAPGASQTNLLNREWWWTNNILYLRWDAGNPNNHAISYAARSFGLFSNSRTFWNASNLWIVGVGSRAMRVEGGGNITLSGCELVKSAYLLNLDSVTNFVCKGCTFSESCGTRTAATPSVFVQGASTTLSMYYCLLDFARQADLVNIWTCQSVSVVNCTFVDCNGSAIRNSSAGTVGVTNCIFVAAGSRTNSYGDYTLRRETNAAGPIYVKNSLILARGHAPSDFMQGVTEVGGNQYFSPRFQSSKKQGIIYFTQDDYSTASSGTWYQLCDLGNARGIPMTLALSMTETVTETDRAKMQEMILRGNGMVSHTRSHADLTNTSAFTLRYTGASTQCVLTITNNMLVTTTNGQVDLRIYLTNAAYNQQYKLVPYLASRPGYTCTTIGYLTYVPTRLLMSLENQDVKTAPFRCVYDQTAFYSNEVLMSRADIQGMFTNSLGAPYDCDYLNYPNGTLNETVVQTLQDYGFKGARGVQSMQMIRWSMEYLYLYDAGNMPLLDSVMVLHMMFETNTIDNTNFVDSSSSKNHFTGFNAAYVRSNAFEGTYSASLNGSNAYFTRATNASLDLHWGDFMMAVQVCPAQSGRRQTLWSHGADAANNWRWGIDADGSVFASVMLSGVETLNLRTPAGAITNGGWQKICLQQIADKWSIRVNDSVRVTASNSTRIPLFGGLIYMGAAYDYGSASVTECFGGLLDKFVVGNRIWNSSHTIAEVLCANGGMVGSLSHGESSISTEIYRVVLDALTNYTGNLSMMTQPAAFDYVRERGTLFNGGRFVSWIQTNAASYRLRLDSPCVGAGDSSAVAGIPNMVDLDGTPITDGSGALLLQKLSLGAYEVVIGAPGIIQNPVSQTAVVGSTAVFSAQTIGSSPLSYQWWRNGSILPGATSGTLTLANVQTANAGAYFLVISNSMGAATSTVATLTVLLPPVITQPVTNLVLAAGNTVTLTASAEGTMPLNFQWQWNGLSLPGATTPTLTLFNVQPGNSGVYSIVVTNNAGAITNKVADLMVYGPPAAPSGLTAVAQSLSQILLSWVDNSGNETAFQIYQSRDGVNYQPLQALGSNTTQALITGLRPGTTYYYLVRATNAAGPSAYSNPAFATTTDAPPPPWAPSLLIATPLSSGEILLHWADNSTNEEAFTVCQSYDGTNYSHIGTVRSNFASAVITELEPETTYFFLVRATNYSGVSDDSNPASATTRALTPACGAPTALNAQLTGNTSVALSWTDNSSNEGGFLIYQSTDGLNYMPVLSVAPNVTTAEVIGLQPATTYYFMVRTMSAGSNPASARTP